MLSFHNTELRSSTDSLTHMSHSGRRTPQRRLAAYPAVNSPMIAVSTTNACSSAAGISSREDGQQMLKLHRHNLGRADAAMQHRLIQKHPEIRAGQNRLTAEPDGDLRLYLVRAVPAPGRKDRPRVVLGLEQPGDQQRFPPAHAGCLRLDLDPVREPPRNRPVRLPRDPREPHVQPVAQTGKHLRDPGRHVFGRRPRPSLGLDDHGPVKSQLPRELALTGLASGQPCAPQLLAQPHAGASLYPAHPRFLRVTGSWGR
jgi:hypothetical protein